MKKKEEAEMDFSSTYKKVKEQLLLSSIKDVEQNNLVSIHSALMNFGRVLFVLPYSVKCSYIKGPYSHYALVPNAVIAVSCAIVWKLFLNVFFPEFGKNLIREINQIKYIVNIF